MNKISKILKSLALVFVIMFAGVSVMACSNSKSKTSAPNATQITDTNTTEENADEINTENQNQNETTENESTNTDEDSAQESPVIEVTELDGIYKITKTITFNDADRANADEVIKYFKTKDFNGIHHVIEKLGYEDNYNPVKVFDHTDIPFEVMLHISNNELKAINFANGVYIFYSNTPVDASSIIKKIEFNEKSNTYMLYIAFSYYDIAEAKTVVTPLLFKVPVQKVEISNDIFEGINYEYKSNSAIVKIDNNDILDQNTYEKKLAEIFNFDTTENVFDLITAELSSYNYILSPDSSRLTVTLEESTTKYFAFCELSNNTFYEIGGFKVRLEDHVFNLETKKDEITLSISIQNETRLVITIVSK